MFRINLSSRARELSGGDALIISIPKSGRTWVRTFLCAYYCRRQGEQFTFQPEKLEGAGIPRVIYSHDLFEHRTKGDRWDRLRGKYLVPGRELRKTKIILLARDPRDAFVSLYLQLSRRAEDTPQNVRRKTMAEMLRHPAFGIRSIVAVMNSWFREFSKCDDFLMLRYETLRADSSSEFVRLLQALGEASPDPDAFRHALDFSEFGSMKQMEAAGRFESKILRAGDVADPESFKVRRGKVGGFADYLQELELEYANDALALLDERFGYCATRPNSTLPAN